MKLKLDLHPIYSDSQRIEQALNAVIDEAVEKRASEVEIIPGKGSGALKKSVLRFLDRPDIKAKYHRLDKDSDNWGRLFVYFRPERVEPAQKAKHQPLWPTVSVPCACCGDAISVPVPEDETSDTFPIACPWCGTPNRVSLHQGRRGAWTGNAEFDYQAV